MKRFGPRWPSKTATCKTPVGDDCADCGNRIAPDDDGVILPYLGLSDGEPREAVYHRLCLVKLVVGSDVRG